MSLTDYQEEDWRWQRTGMCVERRAPACHRPWQLTLIIPSFPRAGVMTPVRQEGQKDLSELRADSMLSLGQEPPASQWKLEFLLGLQPSVLWPWLLQLSSSGHSHTGPLLLSKSYKHTPSSGSLPPPLPGTVSLCPEQLTHSPPLIPTTVSLL